MTSTGTVLSFFRPRQKAQRDWTQEELAQFYRVEAALIRSGLLVDVDRGVSDEGDPWFIFCRQDNGEVIAHFARILDQYVVASSAFPGVARGKDFALLISDLMRSSPLPLPREIQQAQNIYLHPAAMLVALLATAFLVSSESDGHDQHASHSLSKDVLRLLSLGEFAVLSAVAIATTWVEHQIDSGLKILEGEQTSELNVSNTGAHSHVVSDVVSVLHTFLRLDSDLGVHKMALETPLVSFENQHFGDLSVPTPLFGGLTLSTQTIVTEKVFDVSVAVPNGGTVDLGHLASTFLVPDSLTPVQTVTTEFPSGIAQADHSAPVPQSVTSVTAAPLQVSASSAQISGSSSQISGSSSQISASSAQISASSAQLSGPSASSTDAYHALTADLASSNLNLSMTSFKNFSLEPSIQKVLTNVQTGGVAQQITGDQSIAGDLLCYPARLYIRQYFLDRGFQ